MIRHLDPTDIVQLKRDPIRSTFSVPVQVQGQFSLVVMPSMGSVVVQVNNRNFYNVASDYGIAQSYNARHDITPQLNPTFTASWANTSLTVANAASRQFINGDIHARYIRLSGASLTSVSRIFGHVFLKPRIR